MILDYVHQEKQSGLIFTLMIVFKFIIALIGGVILSCISGIGGYATYIASIYSPLAMIVVIMLSKQKWQKTKDCLAIKSFNYQFIFIAIILAVSMIMAFSYLNEQVMQLFSIMGIKISEVSILLDSPFHCVLAVVCLCILPAIFEELFFRGLLLSKLRKFGDVFAILISAMCFALFHSSLMQLIYQFLYGIILSYIAIKSKSIIVSMIIHFLNNLIIISVEFFSLSINYANIFIILGGFILLAVSIFWTYKLGKSKLSNKNAEYKNKLNFFLPFGIMGIGICILSIVLGVIYA